jgi:AcrR family transcriptional regulator
MARTLDLAKRKAILKAAKSIFVKDGYTAAKMFDIASEAGVAPGTLYLYFENKEALASAIGEEFYSRLIGQFVLIVKKIEGPEGVVKLVDWALQIAHEERADLSMVKERNRDLKSKQEGRQRFIAQLAGALDDLSSRDIIRHYDDTKMLADLLLSIMRRVIMSYAIFGDENTNALRTGAISILQHALFDDVSIAANDLMKRKRKR